MRIPIILLCLFFWGPFISVVSLLKTLHHVNNPAVQSQSFISSKIKIPLYAVGGQFGKNNNGASAVELGTPPVETIPVLLENSVQPQRYCYFDRRSPCPCTERCLIDDRFCGANREYFDHVYGPLSEDLKTTETDESPETNNDEEDIGNLKFDFSNIVLLPKRVKRSLQRKRVLTSPSSSGRMKEKSTPPIKESTSIASSKFRYERHQQQLQKLSRKERRIRRKKLFLMSTWIEDLLPDPHQGHSWMVNMVVDLFKISHRAAALMVYSICKQGNKPKFNLH